VLDGRGAFVSGTAVVSLDRRRGHGDVAPGAPGSHYRCQQEPPARPADQRHGGHRKRRQTDGPRRGRISRGLEHSHAVHRSWRACLAGYCSEFFSTGKPGSAKIKAWGKRRGW
jgi:hypothetical protein